MAAPRGNTFALQRQFFSPAERILKTPFKRDWIKKDLNSWAGRKTIIRYNQFRMLNQSEILTKEQWNELGLTVNPTSQMPDIAAKRFLRNEEVKQVANIELAKILSDNNINLDFIVKEQKELLELSKKEKQLNVTHKVIESFKNDLGLNNKVTISETRQTNSNLVDNFNKAKQTITVTSEKTAQIGNNEDGVKVEPDKDNAV